MKKYSANEIANWLDFTLGYISASCSCADSYINHDQKAEGFESYKKLLFIPAFWNFKHALELGIKFLFLVHQRKMKWGHSLINNLQEYKKELGLNDEECKDIQTMCDKYCCLHSLEKLGGVNDNFSESKDFQNQFFHYPSGIDKAHEAFFEKNKDFTYNSFISLSEQDNETRMLEIMKELKKDTELFTRILENHYP